MSEKNIVQRHTDILPPLLKERFGPIQGIIDFLSHKKVPVHKHSFWYYMGGISLFLFIVQVVTGILLMVHYNPGEPHGSVQNIVSQIEFGWLIRSTHSWSANLMIFFVFLHMFSVFFMKSYKYPREFTWMTGFVLLVLCMGFGFSGYLLPWDEVAYFATAIGVKINEGLPVMGGFLADMMRGGKELTTATVQRFYTLHIMVLPLIFVGVLSLHLIFIQIQGMHEPEFFEKLPASERKYITFFPNFVIKDVYVWLLVMNFLGILAALFPWDLGPEADSLKPAPAGIKPEWYFLSMFQFLKLIPGKVLFIDGEMLGMVLFGLVGLIWFAVPFIDGRTASGRRQRAVLYFGLVLLAGVIIFTIWGRYT